MQEAAPTPDIAAPGRAAAGRRLRFAFSVVVVLLVVPAAAMVTFTSETDSFGFAEGKWADAALGASALAFALLAFSVARLHTPPRAGVIGATLAAVVIGAVGAVLLLILLTVLRHLIK